MSELRRFTNRAMAEAYMEPVWEGSDDDREVMDCRVVRMAGRYVLNVTCDTPDGTTQHVLKSPEAVERFLEPPEGYHATESVEVESWDADMGL